MHGSAVGHGSWNDERVRLVQALERAGHVQDLRVADALRRVPRHLFVPEGARREAYHDAPLDIGHGQTISAPHMVAMMLEPALLAPGERVAEIGGGSGYLAAVASELVLPGGHVVTVEIVPELARRSRRTLDEAGFHDVEVVHADGSLGHEPGAPYDAIVVSAAAPGIPPPLLEQLAPGGRLILPMGERDAPMLCRVTVDEEMRPQIEPLHPCRFVPLLGRYGWASP